MAKTVSVTSVQVSAAKLKLKRSATRGTQVSPGVKAIANARRDGTFALVAKKPSTPA